MTIATLPASTLFSVVQLELEAIRTVANRPLYSRISTVMENIDIIKLEMAKLRDQNAALTAELFKTNMKGK